MCQEENMKKSLVLITVIIIAVCSACNGNSKENTDMIEYETGVYYNKDWEDQVGTYQDDVIPDRKTAVAIAVQIFKGMNKSTTAQEYTPQFVFYDEKDSIWVVSFWKETETITFGNDCSIAMQKKDGKVLRIWFGE